MIWWLLLGFLGGIGLCFLVVFDAARKMRW